MVSVNVSYVERYRSSVELCVASRQSCTINNFVSKSVNQVMGADVKFIMLSFSRSPVLPAKH